MRELSSSSGKSSFSRAKPSFFEKLGLGLGFDVDDVRLGAGAAGAGDDATSFELADEAVEAAGDAVSLTVFD